MAWLKLTHNDDKSNKVNIKHFFGNLDIFSNFTNLHIILLKCLASPAQKPGSCYRPGFGRKRRSVEDEEQFETVELDDNSDADTYQAHLIEKRQVNSVYGGQGGNPWKPPAPAPTPSPYRCRNDFDCQCKNTHKFDDNILIQFSFLTKMIETLQPTRNAALELVRLLLLSDK